MFNTLSNDPEFPCPKCGSSRLFIEDTLSKPHLSFISRQALIKDEPRYCPKCSAELWETCEDCMGKGEITVFNQGDRFCSYCRRELWPATSTKECPKCNGFGRVDLLHHCQLSIDLTARLLAKKSIQHTKFGSNTLNHPQTILLDDIDSVSTEETTGASDSPSSGCDTILVVVVVMIALLWYLFQH